MNRITKRSRSWFLQPAEIPTCLPPLLLEAWLTARARCCEQPEATGWCRCWCFFTDCLLGEVRTKKWTTKKGFMYPYEDRMRAVARYIKLANALGLRSVRWLSNQERAQRLASGVRTAFRSTCRLCRSDTKSPAGTGKGRSRELARHDRCNAITSCGLGYSCCGTPTAWVARPIRK